jgi:hypothetical protein
MLKGSCHCGAVTLQVEGIPAQVMECNCSHCSRKGYLLWFVPRDEARVQAEEGVLGTYHFNKHAIDHHFCLRCGCAPYAMGTAPDGKAMIAINARCLEDIDLAALKRIPIDGRRY